MNPTTQRIVQAGLLTGLIVNLVDVPNSALVVSPAWTAVLAQQGITTNGPLMGAYFTALHFVWGVGLMAVTAWLLPGRSPGRAALLAAGTLLLLQRGFGFGTVVMGKNKRKNPGNREPNLVTEARVGVRKSAARG